MKKERKIKSRNPWKYVDHLVPIFETHKVSKEEITNLSCRVNYEVAPRDQSINENDMLYHYFALLCAQDRKFMRTWLHLFICLHKQYFNTLASTYLKRKGLSLVNWLDSIQDGRKGDKLSLLGLCLLIEKHVLVHLSNGLLWSSLKNSADSHLHDDMLNKVDLHMVYLGRGNFALLQRCTNPLQVAESSPNMESIVVGTFIPLSQDKDKILDSLILSGLGVGINRERSTIAKTATSTMSAPKYTSEPSKSSKDGIPSNDRPTTVIKNETASGCDIDEPLLIAKEPDISRFRLILHRLCVKPRERINVTPELLNSIPTTPYSRSTMHWIQENIKHDEATDDYSTDLTMVYWDSATPKSCKKRKHSLRRKKLPSAKPSNP